MVWWTGIFCYLVLTVTPSASSKPRFWNPIQMAWSKLDMSEGCVDRKCYFLRHISAVPVEPWSGGKSMGYQGHDVHGFHGYRRGTGGWGLKNVGWFTVQSNCGKMQIPFWLLNVTEGVAPQIMTHCRCAVMTVSFFKKKERRRLAGYGSGPSDRSKCYCHVCHSILPSYVLMTVFGNQEESFPPHSGFCTVKK